MPRMVAPPYANQKLLTQVDIVRKRRAQRANQSIQREKLRSVAPIATTTSSLANTGASMIGTSPRKMSEFNQFSHTPVQKRQGSMQIEQSDLNSFRKSLEPANGRGSLVETGNAPYERQKKSGSVIEQNAYSTVGQYGAGNDSKLLSKWNMKFSNYFGSKEAMAETMNRGASFLVAPHNLSFDKRSINATSGNHAKVVDGLESILQKHKIEEEKKTKGLSEELA